MMSELYKQFQELSIDRSWIGLAVEDDWGYFCTPIGAEIIGWDNGIHYCFIKGFEEMVFVVNPETCCDYYVYPLARNFFDFLRLIVAVHGTNTLQQIILWDKEKYLDFVTAPEEVEWAGRAEVLEVIGTISRELNITPMENPFEYVKEIQRTFDYDQIMFTDEFYDTTGWERP